MGKQLSLIEVAERRVSKLKNGGLNRVFEVPFGSTMADEFKNAAFVAIHTRAFKPYVNYKGVRPKKQNEDFPGLFMLHRWNHKYGLVGGGVDPGETLEQAARREVQEEIGYIIPQVSALTPICSHVFRYRDNQTPHWMATHLFGLEVSEQDIKELFQNASSAKDYWSENNGHSVLRFEDLGSHQGIALTLREAAMETTVREELLELCRTTGLYSTQFLEANGIHRAPLISYKP